MVWNVMGLRRVPPDRYQKESARESGDRLRSPTGILLMQG